MRRLVLTAVALLVLVGACTGDAHDAGVSSVGSITVGSAAPVLPAGEWVNAPESVAAEDLRGRPTLIHFWRSSCVSCLEAITEIEALRAEFGDDLLVVGVHSPKFSREADSDVVRRAVQQLDYPGLVVNDADRGIWSEWGIAAWPTAAVVDPDGKLAGGHVGLGAADVLRPLLTDLMADIEPTTGALTANLPAAAPTVLSHPEAVLADLAGNRLFIADTGHNRIVIATLDTHVVLDVIGDGTAGSNDGPAANASFFSPRGMTLDGPTLYVADTANHLVRAVDLRSLNVTTVAGTQEPLNNPWDLALHNDGLLVTMAGTNQLAIIDIETGSARPLTSSGLASPAGLTVADDGTVYVADSESSSIKRVTANGAVEHLAGGEESLFDFGDVDGTGAEARMQRPLDVVVDGDALWVADTFNSKIKRIDTTTGATEMLVGGEGWRDGLNPLFSAPAGIDFANGLLYVADRDNHSVRVVDPATGATSTVILKGIELLVADGDRYDGTLVTLDPVEVGEGPGTVVLDVAFPPGYKANELAPSRFEWTGEGEAVVMPGDADITLSGPGFPMEFGFTFAAGEGRLQGDIWLVYCESTAESICLFDRARIDIPLLVTAGGAGAVPIAYEVILPDGL